MSDEDAFSNLSWPEYTEEDLQSIDRFCEEGRQDELRSNQGANTFCVDLEETADRIYKSGENSKAVDKSPFYLFRRWRGYLSVTDIIAPAWCEVQFDYGLRQSRNKPLSKRPESFVTTKGKEIRVKAEVAARNDLILNKGKTVHLKLEREVHKVEVPIKVETKEESWALRLLDFLVRVGSSKTTSVCREVPVWGIIHDHPIFGIIDELHFELAKESRDSNSLASSPETQQKQTSLDSFVVTAPKSLHTSPSKPQAILHIIDNKTRQTPRLPTHVDSLPSRLQLMLYWLMLSQILSASNGGPSFSEFCSRTGADPSRPFSDGFIAEMSALVVENRLSLHFLDVKCLQDMDFPFRETIKDLCLDVEDCVSTRLSLVYRLRGRSYKKPKSTVPSENSPESLNKAQSSVVVKEIAEGPDASIDEGQSKLVAPMDGSVDTTKTTTQDDTCAPNVAEPSRASDEMIFGESSTTASLGKRKRRETRVSSTSTTKSSAEAPAESSSEESEASSDGSDITRSPSPAPFILGTKKFQYNPELLNAHITSVLAWWHGNRPPHGVSIEDVSRCNSCEYKNGCEWREQKAQELQEKAFAKTTSNQHRNTS